MPGARPLSDADLFALFQQCSNWGRWGADDQLGTLNFITPEKIRSASALVREGVSVSCALPLNTVPGPLNPNPVTHLMITAGDINPDGGSADYIAMGFHGATVTHIDSLCHIFFQGLMYNARPASKVTSKGALANSIDNARHGIVSRGVLLDIPRSRGVDWLEPGEAILIEDLEYAEKAQGIRVESGDILLVRTGRHALAASGGAFPLTTVGGGPSQTLAGLEWSTLPWIFERQVAVLGGDNFSDVVPTGASRLPFHAVGIAGMGMHLIDNAGLEDLAAACASRGRWEFQLIVAPLVLEKGTGSPVNPIAVF